MSVPWVSNKYPLAGGGQYRAIVVQFDNVQRILMGFHFEYVVLDYVPEIDYLDITKVFLVVQLCRAAEDGSAFTWIDSKYSFGIHECLRGEEEVEIIDEGVDVDIEVECDDDAVESRLTNQA